MNEDGLAIKQSRMRERWAKHSGSGRIATPPSAVRPPTWNPKPKPEEARSVNSAAAKNEKQPKVAHELARIYRPIQPQVALECTCCKQIYHPDRSFADRIEAALFGAEPYTVCPICEQNVSDPLQTESYKQRWRQGTLASLDDRAVRVAMLSIYLRRGLTSDEGFRAALKQAQQAYPDKTINQLKALGDEALVLLDALRKT